MNDNGQNIEQELLAKLHNSLIAQKVTIATAESCTSGLLGASLTNLSGSSQFYIGGVNTYSDDSKTKLLMVPKTTIEEFGAVSSQVADLMATNICRILNADIGVGITGVAGPTGGTAAKPVGHVWLGIFNKKSGIRLSLLDFGALANKLEGNSLRNAVRIATINETIRHLMLELDSNLSHS